ncbi:MAG: signal peptide peptidase SppA [Bacteroidales bacterium]|nr:signal peptide peptidase SppA [Bacteroidales bacterium]
MLKKFFIALTGSLAAIWISIILLFIMVLVAVTTAIASSSQSSSVKIRDHSILKVDLTGSIPERIEGGGSIIDQIYQTQSDKASTSVSEIVAAINTAANDKRIDGLYLYCGGASMGMAGRIEVRDAVLNFKDSGKWVIAYGDNYTQGDYIIATAADSLIVNPAGAVEIHGLASQTIYFKGLLDKLGVEMQVIKVGSFKSAVEPYILTGPSEASLLQQRSYVDGIWNTMVPLVAESRGVTEQQVNMWADSIAFTWPVERLLKERIVTSSAYEHTVDQLLADLTKRKKIDDLRLLTTNEYAQGTTILPSDGSDEIAVLYAVGDINDSGSKGIVPSSLIPIIDDLADDDNVKGLVLRVNSGGGSAFASEQIWEALQRFKESGKPFYVSMSDYAASGGYYISCGADKIYAMPQTLTGSIGIFGMIPCAQGLVHDKLGLNVSTVSSNANGDFPTLTAPMTPFQRASMQKMVEEGYELFTSRVAAGRDMPIDSVKAIAEGRVWYGVQALENGLVDELGTLEDAIVDMTDELKISSYSVNYYPELNQSLWEMILSAQADMEYKIVSDHLGDSYLLWEASRWLAALSPLQARAENIRIE